MDEYVTEFNWDSVDEFGNPWSVTRERVVRCRDCRYHAGTFCKLHEVMMPDPSEDDGFCAWGEPREEEP